MRKPAYIGGTAGPRTGLMVWYEIYDQSAAEIGCRKKSTWEF